MINSTKIKSTFNVENNTIFYNLVSEITKNNIKTLDSFISWKNYFSRYIDPDVIHRKKDIKEFEKKFDADFFEILYSIHLIVYLFGKKVIEKIEIPKGLSKDLFEDIFESTLSQLKLSSKDILNKQIEKEYENIKDNIKNDDIYDLLENIYRAISPREIRKPLGEYFTPLVLAERMINEVGEEYSNGLWMDNSSGFGVFLFAYLKKFGISKIDNFICIETSPLSVFISKVVIIYEYRNQINKISTLPIFWGDSLLNQRYRFDHNQIKPVGNFSTLFGIIDVVVGNPPWVSWKSMTKEYQLLIGDDWRSYDIFEKNITRNTMGACNDDISSYFVYYSIDKFLKSGGLLKFVINLSLFKSNLVGKQFRKFLIKKNNTPFKLSKIYDLTGYKVFQGITNSYCVFDAIKGEKTSYPIPYIILKSKNKEAIQVIETTARPVKNEEGGAIITVNGNDKNFNAIEGVCEYKARAGVCTWLNSVFWVKKIDENKYAKIVNLGNSGKKKLKEVETEIEKELIFRLLRARNLKDFEPVIENHIVVPQSKNELSKPISEIEMQKSYPLTYNFFLNFKDELLERSGYKKFLTNQPFYGLYNIGPYTLAPIKLGWQFVSKNFQVHLIDRAEDIIPDLNVMFIPLTDMDEAYYLHALLNSKYAKEKIESSSNWTFPSGSIQKIYLEKFDIKNDLHSKISALQKKILMKEKDAHNEEMDTYFEEMDTYFKEYWFNGRGKKKSAKESQLSLL